MDRLEELAPFDVRIQFSLMAMRERASVGAIYWNNGSQSTNGRNHRRIDGERMGWFMNATFHLPAVMRFSNVIYGLDREGPSLPNQLRDRHGLVRFPSGVLFKWTPTNAHPPS